MKRNQMLVIASLLSVLLMTLHLTSDTIHARAGTPEAGGSTLVGVPVLALLLYGKRDGKHEDERVREALRLPLEATIEVRRLLVRQEPLSVEFVGRVAAAANLEPDLLKGYVGRTLAQLYSGAVCGGTLLRVPTGSEVETPMAFQSALAGILLAAELVLDAAGARRVPTRSTLNLLRPIGGQETSVMDRKHESGTCICQDADYVERYRWKYPPAA